MYETITIRSKDKSFVDVWTKDQWDDYSYDSKFFIVKNKGSWIGFYNLEEISTIIVE